MLKSHQESILRTLVDLGVETSGLSRKIQVMMSGPPHGVLHEVHVRTCRCAASGSESAEVSVLEAKVHSQHCCRNLLLSEREIEFAREAEVLTLGLGTFDQWHHQTPAKLTKLRKEAASFEFNLKEIVDAQSALLGRIDEMLEDFGYWVDSKEASEFLELQAAMNLAWLEADVNRAPLGQLYQLQGCINLDGTEATTLREAGLRDISLDRYQELLAGIRAEKGRVIGVFDSEAAGEDRVVHSLRRHEVLPWVVIVPAGLAPLLRCSVALAAEDDDSVVEIAARLLKDAELSPGEATMAARAL